MSKTDYRNTRVLFDETEFAQVNLTTLPNPPAGTKLIGLHTDGKWYAKLPGTPGGTDGALEPIGGAVSSIPNPTELTYYSSGSIKIKKETVEAGKFVESRVQYHTIFDSGIADADSSNVKIEDDSKSWTVDALIGKTVKIVAGTGKGLRAVITDNDADTIDFADIGETLDDTSEYIIIDINADGSDLPDIMEVKDDIIDEWERIQYNHNSSGELLSTTNTTITSWTIT